MDRFVLALIVTFNTITWTTADDEAQIQIFEIRQARDDRGLRGDSDKYEIDVQYYDPDGYALSVNGDRINNRATHKNRNVDLVTEKLINKLRRIVKSKHNDMNHNSDDDLIYRYKDLKNYDAFEENDKTPVVILAHKSVLYHIIPQKHRRLHDKLQSVLRSINLDEDIENRTAPPRTKVRYDYEYDD